MAKKKATKVKTKYVYYYEGDKYEVLKVFRPDVMNTILICKELETNQVRAFNIQDDEICPSTREVQKLVKEKLELKKRIREINQSFVEIWSEFRGSFEDLEVMQYSDWDKF